MKRAWVRHLCFIGVGFLGFCAHAGIVRISFTLDAPSAQAVYVAGEFNDWNMTALPLRRDSEGVWQGETWVQPGEYGYKFVVDGQWLMDPKNAETTQVGGIENSLIRATPPQVAKPVAEEAEGAPGDEYRVWTSAKGSTFQAKLRSCDGAMVVLQGRDSKMVRIHVTALSAPDQRLALGRVPASPSKSATQDTPTKAPAQKGRFQRTFEKNSPLSVANELFERLREKRQRDVARDYAPNLAEESFEVYVPESYDPETPYGLFVFIHAMDDGGIPGSWIPLMDKHKLIYIAANKSGNDHGGRTRRIPLALDATYNMQQLYNIDSNRVYLAGESGGARIASQMAFHFADLYTGAAFLIGLDYWERLTVPGDPGHFWPKSFEQPRAKHLTLARTRGHYVFQTGDKDFNLDQMQAYYEQGYKHYLDHTLFMQIPGLGHERPPPAVMDEILDYLDNGQGK